MKGLLVVTALIEAVAGVALTVSPAPAVSLLLGSALDTAGSLVLARVAGAALLALGLACWRARDAGRDRSVRGIVAAMLLYNAAAAGVLAHAGLGFKLSGIGSGQPLFFTSPWPSGASPVSGLRTRRPRSRGAPRPSLKGSSPRRDARSTVLIPSRRRLLATSASLEAGAAENR